MAALAAAIVALTLPGPFGAMPAAQAKSFEIGAIEVDAQLHADGSMNVVEHITYDFEGEFHNGHRGIPPAGYYTVTDMHVTDAATGEALASSGRPQEFTWHFDARDEQRTFDLS